MRRVKSAAHKHAKRDRAYRRAAAISLLAVVLLTVGVFVKRNPFAHGFQIHADFSTVAQLSDGSDVRIAGTDVGEVVRIGAGPHNSSAVTMSISPQGLPIHSDATMTIKPRLILEGNAYIDLDPGSPEAPEVRSGGTIPIAQTATSVQIDQALDVLDLHTRGALQGLFSQLATGFGGARGARTSGAGAPGYAALRTDVRQLDGALGAITSVAHAALGTQPGDLAGAVNGSASVTSQLAKDPSALADFVSSYDHVVGTLAGQDQALASSVEQFDGLLRAAPGPLAAINAALPKLTSFANGLRPALRVAPSSFRQTNGLLDQLAALVRPPALPALLSDLSPVLRDLPSLERELHTLFSYSLPVTNCLSTHVVTTLNMKIEDGANTTGDPVYLDMLHLFTGLTSLASAVDGNGGTLRLGITTGDRIVDTTIPGLGQVVGRIPNVDGVRPTWLGYGVDPPFRPDQPCAAQRLPDLNVPAGPVPEWAQGNLLSSADERTGR